MASLPVLSGREVVKVFGWEVSRQSGSHIILTKRGRTITLSIPDHQRGCEGYAPQSHPSR